MPRAGRLCLGLDATLHLVEPLGFELTSSRLKRAGLDYWKHVRVERHANETDAFQALVGSGVRQSLVLSCPHRRGTLPLHEASAALQPQDTAILLGNETHGIEFLDSGGSGEGPLEWLAQATALRYCYIPVAPAIRSYNLATTAAMAAHEVSRALGRLDQAHLDAAAHERGVLAERGRWAGLPVDHRRG